MSQKYQTKQSFKIIKNLNPINPINPIKAIKAIKTKTSKTSKNAKEFKKSFLNICSFFLISHSFSFSAWAEANTNQQQPLESAQSPQPATEINEIVVTAQKMPIALKDTTQSTTLYQLNSDSTSNYDILHDIPSLGATSTGSYGGLTSLFIRGGNSNHNLVMLNGVPLNQLSSGIAPVERLPFKQFKQLEVVRGNVSALYGSQAMSGVVNLTQKTNPKPLTLEANVGLGSHGSRYVSGKFGQYIKTDDGHFAYDFNLNHEDRHQQSAIDAAKKININPDRDGMRQNNIGANLYFKKNSYQAEFHAIAQKDKVAYDKESYDTFWAPDPKGYQHAHDSKGRLGYYHLIQQLQFSPQWLLKMDNALVQDHTREYQGAHHTTAANTILNDDLKQRTLLNALELRYQPTQNHTLVAQAETNFQKLDASSYGFNKYKFTQRNTKSGRLAYLYQDDANRLDANFRRDWVGEGQKNTHANSYYFAAARYLTPALQVGLIHAKAFKNPTFNDLYGKWGANPNLQTEKALSYEAFARYALGPVVMRTSAYQNNYKNMIGYDENYTPQNIKQAVAQGIEQSITLQSQNWQVDLFANYQHIRNKADEEAILRRPHVMARLNVAYNNQLANMPFKVGGDVSYRGPSKDYIGWAVGKLPSYTTVGLFAQSTLHKNITARISANNIFNKKAQEVSGYPILGRNVMFDIGYRY